MLPLYMRLALVRAKESKPYLEEEDKTKEATQKNTDYFPVPFS